MYDSQELWAVRNQRRVRIENDLDELYERAVNRERLAPMVEQLRVEVLAQLKSVARLER